MPQQFVIPQFTDEESKVMGPIAVRQFVIVVFLVLFEYLFYKLFSTLVFWIITIPYGGLMLALAFLKVNGFPFHRFLLDAAIFYRRPRFRSWRLEEGVIDMSKVISNIERGILPEKPVSRLAEFSLVVDTGGAFEGFEERERQQQILELSVAEAEQQR